MRNKLGQFVKGEKNGYEKNLLLGHGWNRGKRGWSNGGTFKKGHEVPDKWRKFMAHIGNTFRRGSHQTEETKEKCRIANLGKPAWNKGRGDKTPENKRIWRSIEMRLWRESVFSRDGWICQKCGVRGGTLRGHHIQNFAKYPELRFAIDNGVTLCNECHREFHKIYGQRNNTKEQFNQFIVGQNV